MTEWHSSPMQNIFFPGDWVWLTNTEMFLKLKAIIFFFKIQIYYLKNLNIFFFLYFTIKKNSSPPRSSSLKLVTSRLSTQPSFRALDINSMSKMYSNNKLLHKHFCKVSFYMIPFICTIVCIIVWRLWRTIQCLHFPVL